MIKMKRQNKTEFEEPFHFLHHARIIANDPSFTAWGWVVIDMQGNVIDTGCIKTESEHKKRRIRKGDDTTRRISEINEILKRVIYENNVQIILAELPHGSQNASAAVTQGVVTGILQTIADWKGFPIDWYSEQDAKKHLLGKKSATKQETIDTIGKFYDIKWTGVKYKDEAVADAMAIYHVARSQSSLLKLNPELGQD